MGSIPATGEKNFEHAFLSVICKDDTSCSCVGVLNSSCKTGVYCNVRLLIIFERGCSSMYRKRRGGSGVCASCLFPFLLVLKLAAACDCGIPRTFHLTVLL